ncbi:MAG: hypothetical protein JRJ56_06610, partial [Deltaproteobacteria bacterium]|nr:hypothetical protein [Deltaproteobacteria bacterium]
MVVFITQAEKRKNPSLPASARVKKYLNYVIFYPFFDFLAEKEGKIFAFNFLTPCFYSIFSHQGFLGVFGIFFAIWNFLRVKGKTFTQGNDRRQSASPRFRGRYRGWEGGRVKKQFRSWKGGQANAWMEEIIVRVVDGEQFPQIMPLPAA